MILFRPILIGKLFIKCKILQDNLSLNTEKNKEKVNLKKLILANESQNYSRMTHSW